MTTVDYSLYDDRFFLEISGHSAGGDGDEYEKTEADAVCAALSILTMTLCEKIERMDSDGAFVSSSVTLDNGYACFDLEPREDFCETTETLMEFIMTGIELLEENYPAFVTVK